MEEIRMTCEEILARWHEDNEFINYVGVRVLTIQPGYAEAELVLDKRHGNGLGIIHGGCIYTLADTVTAAAAAGYGVRVTTTSGELHYLSAARNSKKLIAVASVAKSGRTLQVCDVEIKDETGRKIAKGIFSFYNLETF